MSEEAKFALGFEPAPRPLRLLPGRPGAGRRGVARDHAAGRGRRAARDAAARAPGGGRRVREARRAGGRVRRCGGGGAGWGFGGVVRLAGGRRGVPRRHARGRTPWPRPIRGRASGCASRPPRTCSPARWAGWEPTRASARYRASTAPGVGASTRAGRASWRASASAWSRAVHTWVASSSPRTARRCGACSSPSTGHWSSTGTRRRSAPWPTRWPAAASGCGVRDAVLAEYAERFELMEAELDEATLELARELAPIEHRPPETTSV